MRWRMWEVNFGHAAVAVFIVGAAEAVAGTVQCILCQYQIQSCRKRSVLTAGSSTALLVVATKKTTNTLLGTRLFQLGNRKMDGFSSLVTESLDSSVAYAIKYPKADQAL